MWDVTVHHRETETISKFSAQNFRTHFYLSFTGPKQARHPIVLGILLVQMDPCEPHSTVTVNHSTNGPFLLEHMFFRLFGYFT